MCIYESTLILLSYRREVFITRRAFEMNMALVSQRRNKGCYLVRIDIESGLEGRVSRGSEQRPAILVFFGSISRSARVVPL